MNKKDLKDGMIVEDREGCRYIVLENRIVGKKSWNDLHEYKDDLIEKNGFEELDIVKIYKSINLLKVKSIFKDKNLELIWERFEEKLSDNALSILQKIPKQYKWLAVDKKDKRPYIYEKRPVNCGDEWNSSDDLICIQLFKKYFKNLSPNDLIFIDDYVDRK